MTEEKTLRQKSAFSRHHYPFISALQKCCCVPSLLSRNPNLLPNNVHKFSSPGTNPKQVRESQPSVTPSKLASRHSAGVIIVPEPRKPESNPEERDRNQLLTYGDEGLLRLSCLRRLGWPNDRNRPHMNLSKINNLIEFYGPEFYNADCVCVCVRGPAKYIESR